MIKTSTAFANVHIDNLKSALEEAGPAELDYVVLAHPDNRMVAKLQKAFENSSIAVVSLPQNCWALDDASMSEFVEWTLSETTAKGIVLVGHSQGGTPSEAIQVCPTGQVLPANQSSNRVGSLKSRVSQARECVKANEEHFVAELKCLQGKVSLQNGRVANPDFVQGLFYRAESGVFCAYDSEAKQFHALIGDELVG
jgi:carbonic anhydrase